MSFVIHYLIPFLLVLTVLVFVHEFGHFWVARKRGVRVETFSIGFGPKIFTWRDAKGTDWCFSCIPLGGYVKMFGDSDPSSTSVALEGLCEEEKKQTLAHKKPWEKSAVAVAGPAANYIFAIIVLLFVTAFKGLMIFPPIVGSLNPDYPAFKAGIQVLDRIVSINTKPVQKDLDVAVLLQENNQPNALVEIERQGEIYSFDIPLKTPLDLKNKRLGITFKADPIYKQVSIVEALKISLTTCWAISSLTVQGIISMVTGKSKAEVGGILTIGDMASKSVSGGLVPCLWFMAILSINLGLINLFPVPILDGGHILLAGIEGIRRKPLSEKAQERMFLAGFILVALLMVYSTWSDLKRYKIIDFILSFVGSKKSVL